MSKTPRTDEIARGNHVVPTEWAQELEIELNEVGDDVGESYLAGVKKSEAEAADWERSAQGLSDVIRTLLLRRKLTPLIEDMINFELFEFDKLKLNKMRKLILQCQTGAQTT